MKKVSAPWGRHYILTMRLVHLEFSGGWSTQHGYFISDATEDEAFQAIWKSCCEAATEGTNVGPWTTDNTAVLFYRLAEPE